MPSRSFRHRRRHGMPYEGGVCPPHGKPRTAGPGRPVLLGGGAAPVRVVPRRSGRSHTARRRAGTGRYDGREGRGPDHGRRLHCFCTAVRMARRPRRAGVRCGTTGPPRAPLPAREARALNSLDGGGMPSRARLRPQTSCACPLSPTPASRSPSAGLRPAHARRLYPAGT